MSRIFHRPMFRIGGAAGGITSGLRRGYANGEDVQISDDLLRSSDYQGGIIAGWKISKTLGLFIEGEYIKFWDSEIVNSSIGLNFRL